MTFASANDSLGRWPGRGQRLLGKADQMRDAMTAMVAGGWVAVVVICVPAGVEYDIVSEPCSGMGIGCPRNVREHNGQDQQ